ncbi:MAG: hypothetical protein J1G04_02985 [Clostridiales bacterium]|nr:hypothetical protein [Clostridiales bacterium]
MDISKLLPLIMGGKLGEREQAILKASQSSDPAAMTNLLTKIYSETPRQSDVYATFKRIIPAETLGKIIKYFDGARES